METEIPARKDPRQPASGWPPIFRAAQCGAFFPDRVPRVRTGRGALGLRSPPTLLGPILLALDARRTRSARNAPGTSLRYAVAMTEKCDALPEIPECSDLLPAAGPDLCAPFSLPSTTGIADQCSSPDTKVLFICNRNSGPARISPNRSSATEAANPVQRPFPGTKPNSELKPLRRRRFSETEGARLFAPRARKTRAEFQGPLGGARSSISVFHGLRPAGEQECPRPLAGPARHAPLGHAGPGGKVEGNARAESLAFQQGLSRSSNRSSLHRAWPFRARSTRITLQKARGRQFRFRLPLRRPAMDVYAPNGPSDGFGKSWALKGRFSKTRRGDRLDKRQPVGESLRCNAQSDDVRKHGAAGRGTRLRANGRGERDDRRHRLPFANGGCSPALPLDGVRRGQIDCTGGLQEPRRASRPISSRASKKGRGLGARVKDGRTAEQSSTASRVGQPTD